MFESSEQVHHALSEVGYLTDRVTATAVYLAAKLKKPLLLEGPASTTPAATPVAREPEAPSLFAPQVQPEATAAEEERGGR